MSRALLCEILAKLESLLATGETARIDLRRLPLPPDGLRTIQDFLGGGEVDATVRGVGSCSFQKTRPSGVWWGTPRHTPRGVVGEFVEIAPLPPLLKSRPADVHDAVGDLRRRVAEVGATA